MAQDMPAMEAWFAVPCPNKFISVRRSESFLRSSHEILEMNLYNLFTPVRQYLKALSEICGEFEMVAERTLHMPVKTKELVEMGSYIKYCRTTFMDKAKTRILKSIRLAIQLMDFTSLSEEQLRLNSSIVKWLNRIKPIFEEYNDLFENTKYELEERLQRSTEKLNKELEDVGPSLTSLSNMDDVSKIAIYVQFIQKFLRNLEQFDSTVSWINNEEVLFKFPISTYPELDELKGGELGPPYAEIIWNDHHVILFMRSSGCYLSHAPLKEGDAFSCPTSTTQTCQASSFSQV
ncbi:Dynein heavy chain 12, axonemal [Homalodisca vitripennis]|nr:Dynein heavy chain 12, axonemal [Homalodisca vitripennis]